MSYDAARKTEIHDAHQRLIDAFAQSYRCGQPTIVVLPGGMGSQLDRSTDPYRNEQSLPFRAYDPVWLDLEIIFGRDAELIRIQDNGHDDGEHVIVPNGPLRFMINAYDGTEAFFREKQWNYIVFGYDWRRPLDEAASQLEEFLANLRDRVKELRECDPLPTTTLVAHSQGGLVGKIFLHRVSGQNGATVGHWLERLVTIGTPFYGTSKHQDRYYEGQDPLNVFYGAKRIAQIAGSLPGPYILMFADEKTIARDRERLGLERYPMFDDDDPQRAADPYSESTRSRFPPWVKPAALDAARDIRETIVAPLPYEVLKRVFHLRSGLDRRTAIELKWRNIDGAAHDPDFDPSPITPLTGPGDGTVPFWSARLAQTPDDQVYDLSIARDHGSLAEHDETLRAIANLVSSGRLQRPSALAATDRVWGVKKASPAKTKRLIDGARKRTIGKSHPLANDPTVWRRLMEDLVLC